MPIIKRKGDLAAGATLAVLAGSQYEFLPFDALCEFCIKNIEPTATIADGVTASVFSGSDVLMQNEEVDQDADSGRAVYPDDYNLSDVAAAGERLNVTLQNGAGANQEYLVAVKITPI